MREIGGAVPLKSQKTEKNPSLTFPWSAEQEVNKAREKLLCEIWGFFSRFLLLLALRMEGLLIIYSLEI